MMIKNLRRNWKRTFKTSLLLSTLFSLIIMPLFKCDFPTKPEIFSYALDFDGVDDKVIVVDNNDKMDEISYQITLESWIFLKNIGNLVGRVIDRSDNQYDDRFVIEVYELNQKPTVHLNINANNLWSREIPYNQWVHIAGTYDGSTLKIYINGDLDVSQDARTTIQVNESNILIGHGGPDSGYAGAFNGYIDELMIWNTARTDEQLQKDMQKEATGTEEGLINYWKADNGSGQVLEDLTNNAHGQLGSTNLNDRDDPIWLLVKN